MTARMTLFALAAALAWGPAATPAAAADFGVWFHYSSSSPRYHSGCTPRQYVYSDEYYGFYDPVVYVSYLTPRAAVFDDCYPTTYRRTYTRSRYYTAPVRHTRTRVYYRSGRGHHYRRHVSRRYHYSAPRSRIRVYERSSASHYRHSGSYGRYSDSHHRYGRLQLRSSGPRHRYSSTYGRYRHPYRRVRVYHR